MLKILALGTTLIALLPATPVIVLDTGQCLAAAQVRSALAAEKMQAIVIGNRSGYGSQTALIFYASADGSRGYAVHGDKPVGQPSDTICIDSVYRDVRLNDITRPGIPAWARMDGIDPSVVERICKAGRLGYQEQCRTEDESLANLESNGVHVMFVAIGTAINPRDKSLRQNQRLVVSVSPTDNKGVVKSVTPEGASYLLSGIVDAAYTREGEALLR
jgi:hypothetical protein